MRSAIKNVYITVDNFYTNYNKKYIAILYKETKKIVCATWNIDSSLFVFLYFSVYNFDISQILL